MSTLSRFLQKALSDWGNQLEFARELGVSPGTVNKWMSGEHTPNFESCLRIAAYFQTKPHSVFKMAGRLDYYNLYLRHFEVAMFHHDFHARLQALLDRGLEAEVEKALVDIERRRKKA